MANSFTQIHIHIVFAVKFRKAVIGKDWQDKLHKYITGIVQKNEHKLLAINSMPDHMHILVGLRPAQSLSDLIQDIKGSSSKYINDEKFVRSLFRWQEGYGAFSVSKSGVHNVIEYINNQEEHHERVSFNKEFKKLLEELQIGYEEKYLFTELQD